MSDNRIDLEKYAADSIAESVTDHFQGFTSPDDVTAYIDDLETDFDAESACPYYIQQDEILNDYEKDYGSDAESMCDDSEYKASDWQTAKTAYAYAVAYCAYSALFSTAKDNLTEAIEELVTLAGRELETDNEIQVQLGMSCPYGSVAHDKELDGILVWSHGQLDGMNGMASEACGLWISTCVAVPAA